MTTKPRPCFDCAGCGTDVDKIKEYAYMVTRQVWEAALRRHRRHGGTGSTRDLLCLDCLEVRLGRSLTFEDFDWSVGLTSDLGLRRSARLQSRMHETP